MIEQSHSDIRILVAESFELVRLGLRSLFDNHTNIRLVAETSQLDDLFNLTEQHKPDIILMDLLLSGNNNDYVKHIIQLLRTSPRSKILAFSNHNSEQTHLQTFRSGAVGVISKNGSTDLLLKAIIAIHTGHVWFDRNITKLLWQSQFGSDSDSATEIEPQADTSTSQQPRLSDSERHIAHLACKGLSAKEISAQLFVTEKTVRNQLSVIYRKTGVKKQIELCLKAPLYNYFTESQRVGTFSPKDSQI
ncbi:response regulator [Nitrosomonas ureae]|uniref:Two component transcriptional regulator, LuxR family n=1 Tax=Nitrosomonas ureae TaxID=44577 RepID=A0A1H5VLR6_9PROT|nr:response regulator transcription factor [Nitrosomonas ureae]SEF88143.1 two component transcriptional regulator, LuxR family [Nitrosomonas ureae]